MGSPSELAVLMALRVHGRSDAARVAAAVGAPVADVGAVLDTLAVRGLTTEVARPVAYGAPPASLVALSDDGRDALAHLVAAEPIDRAALGAVYDGRFAAADRELKARVTGWQLASETRKAAALDAILTTAATVGGVAAALAAIVPRLAPYPRRIADAAAAVATGDVRFVASPRVDSLHQIWFELHEDLLVTLGRSRSA